MGSLIYSTIPQQSWEVTADTGAVRDPENLFVSRRQSIVFNGTEDQLIRAFPMGEGNYPGAESGMLCSGPVSAQLIRGTRREPHWDVEVQWVGLHNMHSASINKGGIHGLNDGRFNYRILVNSARRETPFPIKTTNTAGADYTIALGPKYVNSTFNPTGDFIRGKLINFLPMIQVIGVINLEGIGFLSVYNPRITALITKLNTEYKPLNLEDWSTLPDPMITWAKGFLEKAKQNKADGAYVPVNLSSHRHLSFGSVHAFTMDLTWEQGISPG